MVGAGSAGSTFTAYLGGGCYPVGDGGLHPALLGMVMYREV